jgi:AraC-like DNA-binding protein
MILLEKLLAGLDAEIGDFAICCLDDGCGLPLPSSANTTVHYSLKGNGLLRFSGGSTAAFGPHTFIVVPPGQSIAIETAAGGPTLLHRATTCAPISQESFRPRKNISADLVLACGEISATYDQVRGLFDYLDVPLVERLSEGEPIRQAFEQLLVELASPSAGSGKMAEALLNQCLVHLLRRYCESGECRLPWLVALEDARLSRVLEQILDRPEQHYTLDRLAEISGMSRSTFAAAFVDAFGRPPFEFLKEVRLRRAAILLSGSSLPVKAIAGRVGFDSRSYFSRAFKDFYGIGPDAYRSREQSTAPLLQAKPAS